MAYLNNARRGIRTTQTSNPQSQLPDIDTKIRTLRPEAMPMISLLEKIGKGPAPKQKKVQVTKHYAIDCHDIVTAVTAGTAAESGYARLTVAQISRPQVGNNMLYYPQDKFYLYATGQIVEVVMTPDAAYQVSGSDITLTTGLTGNTTTRSAAGTVVVRVVEQVNFISPSGGTTDFLWLGRTIWESQNIEAQPLQQDVIYDYNFVEHKEMVIEMTEDQQNFFNSQHTINDWTFQQTEAITTFKQQINYNSFFGERAVRYDQPNRPTNHMRGLLNAIRSNVTIYDPNTVTDYENMISEFMYTQAFKYNNGARRKMAFAGPRFIHNFNKAFREFRRSDINVAKQTPGLDITSYTWMGFTLDLVRNEVFRLGTPHQDWCVVIDPAQAEYRVKKNFESRPYELENERVKKLMVEWQGTIAWHLEEHHALLRTA